MSAIPKYLHYKNFIVNGSDLSSVRVANTLNSLGIKVFNHSNYKEIEDSDIIIYSSAIKENDSELVFAKQLNKVIFNRSQVLGEILKSFNKSVGISGTHGKTTTVAMLAHIIYSKKMSFTTFIGGIDSYFDNMYTDCKNNLIISEVCEFAKNINYISPTISVVTNIDNDHLDCYKNIGEIANTFYNFLSKAKVKIICNDDKYLSKYKGENVITYGIKNDSIVMAKNIKSNKEKYSYSLYVNGKNKGIINLNTYGKYSIYNSLCAISIAIALKVPYKNIINGLQSFNGVKRRLEYIGTINNKKIICDYAHHPTELKNVIESCKKMYNSPLFIFQPHTYSRTKLLLSSFIKVLEKQNIIIYKTYGARESYSYYSSGEYLASEINAKYIESENELIEVISKCSEDTIIFLGAGDIYDIANKLVQ